MRTPRARLSRQYASSRFLMPHVNECPMRWDGILEKIETDGNPRSTLPVCSWADRLHRIGMGEYGEYCLNQEKHVNR